MTRQQLAELVIGNTLHHELAAGSPQGDGTAVFYFAPDGRATARLPSGRIMQGDYEVDDGGYRLNWDRGLQNSRSSLNYEDGVLTCRNRSDGALRSIIAKIAAGDAEEISAPATLPAGV